MFPFSLCQVPGWRDLFLSSGSKIAFFSLSVYLAILLTSQKSEKTFRCHSIVTLFLLKSVTLFSLYCLSSNTPKGFFSFPFIFSASERKRKRRRRDRCQLFPFSLSQTTTGSLDSSIDFSLPLFLFLLCRVTWKHRELFHAKETFFSMVTNVWKAAKRRWW